jgi:hypothetical protein
MIMLFSDGMKRLLFFVLSIFVFMQFSLFVTDAAQLLFTLSLRGVNRAKRALNRWGFSVMFTE